MPSRCSYHTVNAPALYDNSSWSSRSPLSIRLETLNASPDEVAATVRCVACSRSSGTPSPSASEPSAAARLEARTSAKAAEEANATATARMRATEYVLRSRWHGRSEERRVGKEG